MGKKKRSKAVAQAYIVPDGGSDEDGGKASDDDDVSV